MLSSTLSLCIRSVDSAVTNFSKSQGLLTGSCEIRPDTVQRLYVQAVNFAGQIGYELHWHDASNIMAALISIGTAQSSVVATLHTLDTVQPSTGVW